MRAILVDMDNISFDSGAVSREVLQARVEWILRRFAPYAYFFSNEVSLRLVEPEILSRIGHTRLVVVAVEKNAADKALISFAADLSDKIKSVKKGEKGEKGEKNTLTIATGDRALMRVALFALSARRSSGATPMIKFVSQVGNAFEVVPPPSLLEFRHPWDIDKFLEIAQQFTGARCTLNPYGTEKRLSRVRAMIKSITSGHRVTISSTSSAFLKQVAYAMYATKLPTKNVTYVLKSRPWTAQFLTYDSVDELAEFVCEVAQVVDACSRAAL